MKFFYSVIGIVVIDLALSGDNAIVIGMAAHRLPSLQQRAILIGGSAAIVLRIMLTAIAALLLKIPGLQFVGGLLLIGIAFSRSKRRKEPRGYEGGSKYARGHRNYPAGRFSDEYGHTFLRWPAQVMAMSDFCCLD
jgi:predicted tellurium resistance membrane protein TerC